MIDFDTENSNVAPNRYYDPYFQCDAVKILPGEYYATTPGSLIVTVLGSCVSACIRDKVSGISGMNHFLLPNDGNGQDNLLSDSARYGVYAMELGGPEVGRGCGGRGIIHGFELLEKLGFHEWGFDYVLLDFLGDVVCGGFGLPIARDMCQKVIVVASNDLQSLYVANNVCSAVEYFRKLGGNVGVAGMVINKDDGTGEAQAFATNAGIPVLAAIPANEDIRRKSASYEIIGRPDGEWGPLFAELAKNVAEAPPQRPKPQTQDQLLGLFSADVVGRNVVLEPATVFDMVGKHEDIKPSLEVVYDAA